jgi:predicted HicB family RNase H-like nuclease
MERQHMTQPTTHTYRNFIGSVQVSLEDNVLHGKLLNITDVVSYEADTVPGLKRAFEEAVDDYIATCEKLNREANKPSAT